MGRIQASTGLFTGFPIQETVDKLIALQAQPRDALAARQKVLQAEQAAYTDLTALTLGVQFAIRRFSTDTLFSTRKVTSSDPSLLTATASSDVTPGQYQFVPARLAQSHHAISGGIGSGTEALGGGTFSFRFGGHVNSGVSLANLNGGAGVSRGQIKITDRSGAFAVIDLRYAQTVDDVLQAVNSTTDIDVRAQTVGDRLVLLDSSGGTGNLRVQEVGGGTTAADLGLASINVAANEAAGQNLVRLFDGIALSDLRDGSGISLRPELPDLEVTFRDGSAPLQITLADADDVPTTLGDLLERINTADPTRLRAQISADGLRIELVDLTNGAGTFAVSSPLGGSAAEELGLTNATVGGNITGNRLISGLKTTLLNSLSGGQGLGTLGTINLTDRSGASASVNLAGAETLDDVIEAINDAGLGIVASYNSARNGIVLADTTGSTASNLIVANGDATNSATRLNIAANVAATSLDSGSLDRQTISRSTLLSSYNGGQGVKKGTFTITNSAGTVRSISLNLLDIEAVGDLIDKINSFAIGVEARINDSGDGIALIDTAGGAGTLTVADLGTGRTAADLHLRGSGTATTIDGQPAQLLNGTTTLSIELDADDTLSDLVTKINERQGGATASILNTGGSLGTHLSLLSGVAGKAGELLIDGSDLGLSFRDLTSAQDALLQVGGQSAASVLLSSQSNQFQDVVEGLDVTLVGAGTSPVTITVSQSADDIAAALQTFVDQYNKLREKLDTYTAYDPTAGTKGTLFASKETLRLDADLARALTARYFNDGSIRSLAELGIGIDDQGKLSLDNSKLQARFNADPDAVTEFFTDEDRGFADRLDTILESLVGRDRSMLVTRAQTLQTQIEDAAERIDTWNERLARSRERLMKQFIRMETIVTSLQSSLQALSQIQFISLQQPNNN